MAWFNAPITHGYISGYQGPGTDTPHYAIDVATPLDTPFSFPTAGTIQQADYAVWSGESGGGEVFLKPDNGSTGQYAYHLDELDVHPGQHVAAGQVVGLTGGQNEGGSHPTSPLWSSGPHLHYGFFQQYVNTPAGSRPYGPDITNYYKNLANSGSSGDSGSWWGNLLNGFQTGNSMAWSDFQAGNAAAGQSVLGSLNPLGGFTADLAIRGALILGGFILMIMGLHSLLSKGTTINMPSGSAPQGQQGGEEEAGEGEGAAGAGEAGEAAEVAAVA